MSFKYSKVNKNHKNLYLATPFTNNMTAVSTRKSNSRCSPLGAVAASPTELRFRGIKLTERRVDYIYIYMGGNLLNKIVACYSARYVVFR